MSEPNDLLLDGDDDLLDYFLGEDQGNIGDLDMGGVSVGANSNVYMEEVNDGMASLFSKEQPKDAHGAVPSVLGDDVMFGDNFGLLEPLAASPPQQQWNQAQANIDPLDLNAGIAGSNARGRGRGRGSSSGAARGRGRGTSKAKAGADGNKRSVQKKSAVKQEKATASAQAVKLGQHETKVVDETEEKRLRRLARNRESARQSRRRKKEHLELLEERVAKLTAELDELRRSHIEKVEAMMKQSKLAQLQELARLSQEPNSRGEVHRMLENVLKLYGPNSDDEKKLIEYHYKHIFALLLPTYTRYFVWMLNEGEQFFEDPNMNAPASNGKPSVWQSFCNEIHLSQDQQEKLKSDFKQQHGETAREERLKLNTCIKYLEQLRKGFSLRSKVVETQSRALFNILTPEQIVKYLLWTENNRARIEETGAHDLLFLSAEASGDVLDPKLQAAKAVLEKPEDKMQLSDLKILMAALDGQ